MKKSTSIAVVALLLGTSYAAQVKQIEELEEDHLLATANEVYASTDLFGDANVVGGKKVKKHKHHQQTDVENPANPVDIVNRAAGREIDEREPTQSEAEAAAHKADFNTQKADLILRQKTEKVRQIVESIDSLKTEAEKRKTLKALEAASED